MPPRRAATDGVRVYAIFATGDLAAFDYDGKRLWNKNLGVPESIYGYSASLAMDQGRGDRSVLTKAVIRKGGSHRCSASMGRLAGRCGRRRGPVENSWSSPIVAGGCIYTAGNPWVIAYDAAGGQEIWKAKLLEGDVAASPVFRDGVLYVANDRAVAAAIRTDGHGDVTATHVLWKNKDPMLPDMSSPITDGKRLLFAHGGGSVDMPGCGDGQRGLDARSGRDGACFAGAGRGQGVPDYR